MTVYFTDINHMIAFIITYTCQLLQLMSYKIDVQNFSYKFKNTLVLRNCTFCFKQGLWCMEFYSPFQGISLVYQQKIVNIKTLFILNAFEEKNQFQLFSLNSFLFHLKLSHSQPSRKSLAIDKIKKIQNMFGSFLGC